MTDYFIEPAYKTAFDQLGLTSIDAIFGFEGDKNLSKANLAPHRSRIEFQIDKPHTTLFLKRYDRPPVIAQLKNRLSAKRRVSMGFAEFDAAKKLAESGINTPKAVAWGAQAGRLFEKRSFVILEKVPQGESLERRLPDCFSGPATPENLKMRRSFIGDLAKFIKKFHDTGCRHRDLYLCHIFHTADCQYFLIDLARVFRPAFFRERYLVKDLAQLNYSSPAKYFSNTDRMRFYFAYKARQGLASQDKTFIRKIIHKTRLIALHDANIRQRCKL
jgi:RIO-like serine/threonine protein kinase